MDNFTKFDYQYNKFLKGIYLLIGKKKILSAFELAKKAHTGQKRDEGQKYIIHPVRVANCFIYELSITNPTLIIAGLLHDVVEDCDIKLNQIKKLFGEKVVRLVDQLTRNKAKETKWEKFLKTMNYPKKARILKSIDWLDNFRSMQYRKDRKERYWRHLGEVLGMYMILAQKTDKYIYKEMLKVYRRINKLVK